MADINGILAGQEGYTGTEHQTPGEGDDKILTTFTQAQVDEMLQRNGDKRVSDALNKQKAKNTESDKLRDMNESERKTYDYDQRVKVMDARESEFNLMSNTVEAQKILSTRGLPVEFSSYIVAEDADTMMANIKVFEKQFKIAVNDAVSKKIASPTPKSGSSTTQAGMTKEKFSKLNVAQQSELYKTNPSLYKEMTTH